MPFAATWMDVEIIILSKVSQKEERQILYITYMWNLKKMIHMNLFTKRELKSQIQKTNLLLQKGKPVKERNKLSLRLTYHVHIDTYKTDNQQVPTYGKGTKHFQYLITYNVKEFEKEYICIYN